MAALNSSSVCCCKCYQTAIASLRICAVVCWEGNIKTDAWRMDRLVRKVGSVVGVGLTHFYGRKESFKQTSVQHGQPSTLTALYLHQDMTDCCQCPALQTVSGSPLFHRPFFIQFIFVISDMDSFYG